MTAVWTPVAGAASTAGAGITTASSAAPDGAAKASVSAAVAASRARGRKGAKLKGASFMADPHSEGLVYGGWRGANSPMAGLVFQGTGQLGDCYGRLDTSV